MADPTYVREKCSCGAEFEMEDGGWFRGDEKGRERTGRPLAIVELEEWRAAHDCPNRPVVTISSQSPA